MVHRCPQTIQLTNHSAIGHVLTIQLPDMSDNRMPTVFRFQNVILNGNKNIKTVIFIFEKVYSWVGGWVDWFKSGLKDCLHQLKTQFNMFLDPTKQSLNEFYLQLSTFLLNFFFPIFLQSHIFPVPNNTIIKHNFNNFNSYNI